MLETYFWQVHVPEKNHLQGRKGNTHVREIFNKYKNAADKEAWYFLPKQTRTTIQNQMPKVQFIGNVKEIDTYTEVPLGFIQFKTPTV